MRAAIRRLHTPDAPSLHDFVPEDASDFALLVQVIAGPHAGEGEESFDVAVVTPTHLAKRLSRSGPLSGRHLLIVDRFDADAIQRWLERAVAGCTGATWKKTANKLSRIGHWEFEDYEE